MPTFTRVRDKATGHEYDVAAYDPDLHVKVNAPRQYPDLSGPAARPRPAKFRTDKAGQPANDTKES